MATDADGVSGSGSNGGLGLKATTRAAIVAGLAMAVAAGAALWSGQGAEIFLAQAFAALAACF